MKKRIAILGSTGSIGSNLIKILENDKKNFVIELLTANSNYKKLLSQIKKFNVKNVIILNKKSFIQLKKKTKGLKINIFNNFKSINKILKKKKLFYTMSSIVGLNGLYPTLELIKYSQNIAIANKESLICGWDLIKKELLKNNTNFIPVDSEHFSVWFDLNNNFNEIEKVYLTASGGPFINLPTKKFKYITTNQALKHPNWKMGKKISVDSATMMNKVYEIIEAKNIFNLNYKKLSILTHPSSYVHGLITYKNGLTKLIVHDTDMKIPIFNSLYLNQKKIKLKKKNINLKKLNNLDFKKINYKKFPAAKILQILPDKSSLFDTIIVSINDDLVNKFLNKQIKFNDISSRLLKLLNNKLFIKYKRIKPKKIKDIIELDEYVRSKINSESI